MRRSGAGIGGRGGAEIPILDQPLIALTAALSLALVLAVGLVSARRTRDTRDFFIAG